MAWEAVTTIRRCKDDYSVARPLSVHISTRGTLADENAGPKDPASATFQKLWDCFAGECLNAVSYVGTFGRVPSSARSHGDVMSGSLLLVVVVMVMWQPEPSPRLPALELKMV